MTTHEYTVSVVYPDGKVAFSHSDLFSIETDRDIVREHIITRLQYRIIVDRDRLVDNPYHGQKPSYITIKEK